MYLVLGFPVSLVIIFPSPASYIFADAAVQGSADFEIKKRHNTPIVINFCDIYLYEFDFSSCSLSSVLDSDFHWNFLEGKNA